ncbi:MAG: glycosyltransferase family 1 protein [Candidatus Microsaccharimonas sp.]
MKFLFDARYIRPDFHDGISRYSVSMGNALSKLMPVTFIISDEKQRDFLPKKAKFIRFHKPTSAKEPFSALLLNKYHPDVVFSPMQTIGALGRKFKLILTLHDMIYYRHRTPPKDLNPLLRLGWYLFHLTYVPQRLVLNRADLVITVSETAKKQFEAAKLTKRSIVAIPSAPSTFDKPPKMTQSDFPKNIVYMGSFMPYKNVETLIRAMEWLPGRSLHLLSRISIEREKELRLLIPRGAEVIFHRGVTDQEYAQILAEDAIFASASLDEGYGLPLAEALSFGVPAVVSDIDIFHEVGGKGALYFNPHDPKDFAKCVKTLDDATKKHRLIAAGKKRMKQFTWDAAAQSLRAAIKSLQ